LSGNIFTCGEKIAKSQTFSYATALLPLHRLREVLVTHRDCRNTTGLIDVNSEHFFESSP